MVKGPLQWEHWPAAKAMLLRSVDRTDDVTIEEIEAGLESGQAQLWAVLEGELRLAGVTQLIRTKWGRQCFIWQLAGDDFAEFGPALTDAVTVWAKAEGCASIEGNMRPGFAKFLTDWRRVTITLRKELNL